MPAIQYDSSAFTFGQIYMLCLPQDLFEEHRPVLEAFTQQLAMAGSAMTLHPFSEAEMEFMNSRVGVMGNELVWVRGASSITQRGSVTHYLLEKVSGDTCLTIVEDR